MARPRKEYGSEQARIEALRKANRDRVNRHRNARRAEQEEAHRIAEHFDQLDANVPPFDPSTALPIDPDVLKRMKEPSWRDN